MKKLFILLAALTFTLPVCAQPAIQGQVFLQNSKTRTGTPQTIPGVEIKADSAAPTTSDAQGRFTLQFTAVKDLKQAHITAQKHGLVLVNEHELLSAIIGSEAPLKVFLADSALLAEEQAILYDINLKVLTREKDRLIAKLKSDSATCTATIAELGERFNREFEHRWAAQDFLEEQLQHMKEQLPERMAELARVNLDFASERYVQAYRLFKEGQTELAMRLLDNLDAETAQAKGRLEEIFERRDVAFAAKDSVDIWAKQIVASYRLKAEGHNLKFEYRKAAGDLEKGLGLLLRVKRGVEDLEVAGIYGDLWHLYANNGEYPKALEIESKNIAILETFPDGNNPDLSGCYSNIATIQLDMGNAEKALEAIQMAINIHDKIRCPGYRFSSTLYNNLAMVYMGLGKYEDALQAQVKSIGLDEKAFDTADWRHVTSLSNLGKIQGELGHYQQSIEAITKAIDILEEGNRSCDPHFAACYNNLAMAYEAQGDYAKAIVQQRKAIQILEKSLEPGHPNIAKAYTGLAGILKDVGEYSKAIEIENAAIKIQENVFGPIHPDIAISYHILALTYELMGDFEKAISAQTRVVEIEKDVLRPNHLHIAWAYCDYAVILHDMGEYESAIAALEEIISTQTGALDRNHPVFAAIYHNLALNFNAVGQFGKALDAEERAIKVFEIALESDQPKLAASFNNKSIILKNLKENEKAFEAQSKAIEILERATLPNHRDIANAYGNLGLIYFEMGQMSKALAAQRKAIRIRAMALPSDHPEQASSYHNIGTLYYQDGDIDSAIHFKHMAYAVWSQKLPDEHPNLITVKEDLAFLHANIARNKYDRKDYKSALVYFKEALAYSKNEPELHIAIALTHFLMREYDSSITEFELAEQLGYQLQESHLIPISIALLKLRRIDDAFPRLEELKRKTPNKYYAYYGLAVYFALKGIRTRSLENLEKAIQLGYTDLNLLKTEVAFDKLHDHPRYIALIKALEEKQK